MDSLNTLKIHVTSVDLRDCLDLYRLRSEIVFERSIPVLAWLVSYWRAWHPCRLNGNVFCSHGHSQICFKGSLIIIIWLVLNDSSVVILVWVCNIFSLITQLDTNNQALFCESQYFILICLIIYLFDITCPNLYYVLKCCLSVIILCCYSLL